VKAGRVLIVLLCAGATSFAGCAVRTTRPYDLATARAPATGPVPEIFRYTADAQPIADELRPDLDTRTHMARGLVWQSVGDNGQPGLHVLADYFQSKAPGAHPLVIVLPLWGTYTYPPQKIADGIRDRDPDTHVLRVLGERYLFDWDELASSPDPETLRSRSAQMSERVRVTVIDVRRILDWAMQRPEIDPQRIAVVGFSMSAVVGGLLLGSDDRVHSAALVMGGADLHDIIAQCNGPFERVRDEILTRFAWTQEQYHQVVEDTWSWLNPTRFPARIDAARILMFDAQRDECMPQHARDDFWETLGRPRRISFHYGHKKSFLAMTPLGFNYMRRQIYRFLEATL
jgi:hypothetical protein